MPVTFRSPFRMPPRSDLTRAASFYFDVLVFTWVCPFPNAGGPVDRPWGERIGHVSDPDDNLIMITASLGEGA